MKLRHVFALGLAIAPHLAFADWQWTKWGMTPDVVVAKSGGKAERFDGKIDDDSTVRLARGSYEINGLQFDIVFAFGILKQDLARIDLTVRKPTFSRCNTLQTMLLDLYGPPEQTGGIPSIKLTTSDWRDKSNSNRVRLAYFKDDVNCIVQYQPLTTKASGL